MSLKIYLATLWKNPYYEEVLKRLRDLGHEVYDFRDPSAAFKWSNIQLDNGKTWQEWDAEDFFQALCTEETNRGFKRDFEAIKQCEALIMLTPCGNSAHLELGLAAGLGKYCIVYYYDYTSQGPDLMVKVADKFIRFDSELEESLLIAELQVRGEQKLALLEGR